MSRVPYADWVHILFISDCSFRFVYVFTNTNKFIERSPSVLQYIKGTLERSCIFKELSIATVQYIHLSIVEKRPDIAEELPSWR